MISPWGIDHGGTDEVEKRATKEERFKAGVWNKDMLGRDDAAKNNRKLHRKIVLREQGKGALAGATAGGGIGALIGLGTSAATRGRIRARRGAGHGALYGGAIGGFGGQSAGDYRGRVMVQRHPDYKRR